MVDSVASGGSSNSSLSGEEAQPPPAAAAAAKEGGDGSSRRRSEEEAKNEEEEGDDDDDDDPHRKRAAVVAGEEKEEGKADASSKKAPASRAKPRGGGAKALKQNEDLYSNFITLDEKFVSGSGNVTSCWVCICLYCQQDYDAKVKSCHGQEFRIAAIPVPKRHQRSKRVCETHLNGCKPYKLHRRNTLLASNAVFVKTLLVPASASPASALTHVTTASSSAKTAAASAAVAASTSSTTTKTTGRQKRRILNDSSILEYFVRPMSEEEVSDMEEKLIEMIVDSHLPFNIVERPSFLRFVSSLRNTANTRIPGRTKLKEKLLVGAAKVAKDDLLELVKTELGKGHHAGLIVDVWMNVRKIHIEGVILKAGDEFFALQADQADYEHDGMAVARGWEVLIIRVGDEYHGLYYFLSDDAGQCSRARRILALRHPHMIWMRCWAHQINLMVHSLIKNAGFAAVCKQAIMATNKITASSSKWMPQLKNVVVDFYGKKVSSKIYTVAETRWNTTQQCFASQLRMRDACKNFVQKFENVPKFPDACKVWADDAFWHKLEEAELLIRPLCDASYLMQRNKGNTIAHVVLVFLVIYNHVREYCGNSPEVDVLKKDLESRWHGEDNPLFFLAFALHPSFHHMAVDIVKHSEKVDGSWGRKGNALSVVRLAKAATFYYSKHKRVLDTTNQEEELLELDKCMRQWLQGTTKDMSRYKEGENASEWWNENRTEHPELAQLATFLLDCPVQGAACERLFKDFALFHTKQRNRLNADTVYKSTLVKHMLRRKYPEDKARSASTKHTNRLLSGDQYTRINVPLSPVVAVGGRRRMEVEDEQVSEAEEDEQDEEEDDDDDEDEEENPSSLVDIVAASRRGQRTAGAGAAADEEEEEEEELCELDIWLEVLRTVVPDDGTFYEDDDDDSSLGDLYGSDEQDVVEDSYEVAPTVLVPLPTVDNKKFAQEDKHYFKKKKYVRNDKYGLDKLLPEGMILPPLSSIYKM